MHAIELIINQEALPALPMFAEGQPQCLNWAALQGQSPIPRVPHLPTFYVAEISDFSAVHQKTQLFHYKEKSYKHKQ